MSEETKKLTVYICGPISGLPNLNREAFEAAEQALRKKGYEPINPHKIPEHVGAKDQSWHGYMKRCIPYLMKADLVVLLPGYVQSKGAWKEWELCQDLHIHYFLIDTVLIGSQQHVLTIMQAIEQVWHQETREQPALSQTNN